jgi:hypothetical protein
MVYVLIIRSVSVPHECKFYRRSPNGEEHILVTGQFEDNEWNALMRYLRYARDLAGIELLRRGGPGRLTVNYKEGQGLSYSVDLPPEDQFLALLHRLRPFILQNEETNFYRICKHLGRRLEDHKTRQFLLGLRSYFSGQRMQDPIQITSNNVLINSEETLQKWLNAHEYHKDPDKQRELELLHQIMPLEASRAIFAMILYDKTQAIIAAVHFIGFLAGERQRFSYQVD